MLSERYGYQQQQSGAERGGGSRLVGVCVKLPNSGPFVVL